MFATYLLNIRRLLTKSTRRRPNLHVKSEHLANIPQILVSHIRLCLPSNRRVFASCSQKLFAAVHFFRKGVSISGLFIAIQCLLLFNVVFRVMHTAY